MLVAMEIAVDCQTQQYLVLRVISSSIDFLKWKNIESDIRILDDKSVFVAYLFNNLTI